jgi:hypothetical protein
MYPVRCSGCRRQIGVAKTDSPPFRQGVFCSRLCAEEPTAYATMDREDLWDLLEYLGWTTGQISRRWGVKWSVVSRATSRRWMDGEPV